MNDIVSKEKCIEVNRILFLDFQNQFKKVYGVAPEVDLSEREVVYWLYMNDVYTAYSKELLET